MKYTLREPVTITGKDSGAETVVTEITLREKPCTGDMRGLSLRDVERLDVTAIVTVLGRLSGHPDLVINKLAPVDFYALTEAVYGFLGLGPKTESTTQSQ